MRKTLITFLKALKKKSTPQLRDYLKFYGIKIFLTSSIVIVIKFPVLIFAIFANMLAAGLVIFGFVFFVLTILEVPFNWFSFPILGLSVIWLIFSFYLFIKGLTINLPLAEISELSGYRYVFTIVISIIVLVNVIWPLIKVGPSDWSEIIGQEQLRLMAESPLFARLMVDFNKYIYRKANKGAIILDTLDVLFRTFPKILNLWVLACSIFITADISAMLLLAPLNWLSFHYRKFFHFMVLNTEANYNHIAEYLMLGIPRETKISEEGVCLLDSDYVPEFKLSPKALAEEATDLDYLVNVWTILLHFQSILDNIKDKNKSQYLLTFWVIGFRVILLMLLLENIKFTGITDFGAASYICPTLTIKRNMALLVSWPGKYEIKNIINLIQIIIKK